jgi:hypothetical protein
LISRFQVRVLGGSLEKVPQTAGKGEGSGDEPEPSDTTFDTTGRISAQCVVHRLGQPVIHTGQDVGVRVERYRDGRVAQELLHELDVDAAGEQDRGARVPLWEEPLFAGVREEG